jgi:hypothetical protein
LKLLLIVKLKARATRAPLGVCISRAYSRANLIVLRSALCIVSLVGGPCGPPVLSPKAPGRQAGENNHLPPVSAGRPANTEKTMIAQNHSTIERPAVSPSTLADRTAPSYCTRSHSSALDLADRLITEPDCSAWLRGAIVRALARDPVDAVADTEILLSILSARLEEIQGGAK